MCSKASVNQINTNVNVLLRHMFHKLEKHFALLQSVQRTRAESRRDGQSRSPLPTWVGILTRLLFASPTFSYRETADPWVWLWKENIWANGTAAYSPADRKRQMEMGLYIPCLTEKWMINYCRICSNPRWSKQPCLILCSERTLLGTSTQQECIIYAFNNANIWKESLWKDCVECQNFEDRFETLKTNCRHCKSDVTKITFNLSNLVFNVLTCVLWHQTRGFPS